MTEDPKPVVDIHIHVGGKSKNSGCYMSQEFLYSLSYMYMVVRSGINPIELVKDHDKALTTHLIERLNRAKGVDYGVLLAMDGVYRNDGEPDLERTHMVTPNEFVMDLVRKSPKALFGASVNPNRGEREGKKELEKCIEGGAVLVKWIPNSQIINPADPKHDWFYRELAYHRIPLLCHTGREHAVPVNEEDDQDLGHPRRLKRALDKGVTVIAAHCATRFFPFERDYLRELSNMMKDAEKKGWNLYADISAMCSFVRMGVIEDVLQKIPEDRMVLGSDYPTPVDNIPPFLCEKVGVKEYVDIAKIDSPIEKNYRRLLALGFPESAMTRGAELIRMPNPPA